MTAKEQQAASLKYFRFKDWDDFIERLASGELSIFGVIRANQEQIHEKQDYEAYITQARALNVLMQDVRILDRLRAEIAGTIKEIADRNFDQKMLKQDITAKDGFRLFEKLWTIQAEAYGDGPPLISGKTFEECLAQYQSLCGYVEELWDRACNDFAQKNYPLATFFSILAIEEIGKLGRLWHDLMAWDRTLEEPKTSLGVLARNHQKKHFLGVIPGSIINARLDRLIGKKTVKAILEDAESGKMEKLRQSCLYIDFKNGRSLLPVEQVSRDTATIFVTLSGELWLEILSHFPWDFQRKLEKVKKAELAIGLPEEMVKSY